jgi:hypothetical protein
MRPAQSESPAQPDPNEFRARVAAERARQLQAVRDMDEGRFEDARALIQGMIDNPSSDFEAVEAHRLMSQLCRHQNDIAGADAALRAATAALDARPALEARTRSAGASLRAILLMDRADLAAFARRDRAEAIRLYDAVLALQEGVPAFASRLAAQNAAMLCASSGRLTEGVQRLDNLFASPAAADIEANELPELKVSQASWLAESGELAEAQRRYAAVWEEFGNREDLCVLKAGWELARMTPVCADRLAMCRTLFSRTEAIRSAPQRSSEAPTDDELAKLESDVFVVVANSSGCGPEDEALVVQARARFGLPLLSR